LITTSFPQIIIEKNILEKFEKIPVTIIRSRKNRHAFFVMIQVIPLSKHHPKLKKTSYLHNQLMSPRDHFQFIGIGELIGDV
jgi:hypothetical protein